MSVRSRLKNLDSTRHTSEIEYLGALGRPRAVKTLVTGQRLLEWRSGFLRAQMIAVLFDRDGQFVRIAARSPNAPPSLDDIDLREAIATSDAGHGLWARSPR